MITDEELRQSRQRRQWLLYGFVAYWLIVTWLMWQGQFAAYWLILAGIYSAGLRCTQLALAGGGPPAARKRWGVRAAVLLGVGWVGLCLLAWTLAFLAVRRG